jgi:trimeric autotransporter adhesin
MKLVGLTSSVLAAAVAVAVVLGSLGGKPTVEVVLADPTGLEEGASTSETGEAGGESKEQSPGILFTLEAAVVHEGKLHWATLQPGSTTKPQVYRVARLENGRWLFLPGRFRGRVNALASSGDRLLAAGAFEAVDEKEMASVASWDGRKWRPVTGWFGVKLEHEVEAMTVDTSGNVLVGGHSLKLGPGVRATVAVWNGWRWRALENGPAVAAKARFRSLAYGPKGRVYLLFDEYGDAGAHSHLWEWDGDRHWREMPGAEFMSELAVTADGSVYVAGRFGPPSLPEGTSLARWDGRVWQQVGGGLSYSNRYDPPRDIAIEVSCLTVWRGDLIVGGGFRRAGAIEANLIARWDGREWQALGEGLGPQGLTHMDGLRHSVYFSHYYPRLLVGGEAGLYVRGNFMQAGGVAVQGLARWDGTAWTNPVQEDPD